MKKINMTIYNKFNLFFLLVLSIILVSCEGESIVPDNRNTTPTEELKDTILTNIAYGTHPRNVYDIHLPAKRDSNTPVILLIHGGSWKAGQKEDFNYYIQLIKQQWKDVAIVNMNYRYVSNANNIHHSELMADIDLAVNQISVNATKYHISSNIGVVGASAGAHLAMIYAYKYNSNIKCVGDIFGPTIFNDWDWYNAFSLATNTKTGDVLAEYVGQPWDTTAYKAVSPYWNLSSSTQPTIIFHGSLDPIVPVYHSQWLHSKLKGLNVPTEYHEYFAFHGFDINQTNDVLTKLIAFFKIHLK